MDIYLGGSKLHSAEAAAGCAEIGDLPLVSPGDRQLNSVAVNEKPQIIFPFVPLRVFKFRSRTELLNHAFFIGENLFKGYARNIGALKGGFSAEHS